VTYHWTIPLVAAVLNAAVAFIVLRQNSRSDLHRCFALLGAAIAAWNINIFVLYSLTSEENALYWSAVFRVGTLMAGSIAAHFMVLFSGNRSKLIWAAVGLSYGVALLLVGANAIGLLITRLQWYSWGFFPVGTRLYELFAPLLGFNFILAQGVLLHVIAASDSPRQRQQAKLWIIGTLIAMPFGMTNLLLTFGIQFYPLGNLASVVYAGFIAYGIVRYRLMDTDLIITKGGAYAAVIIVVVGPAFFTLLWLQNHTFGRVDTDFSICVVALAIVVGIVFPWFRQWAEDRLERSLFRRKHEYREQLISFSRDLVRILEPGDLVRQLGQVLSVKLDLDRVAVALATHPSRELRVCTRSGPELEIDRFGGDGPFARLLLNEDVLLRDEVEASSDIHRQECSGTLQRNGWEVVIPMRVGQKLVGFIALGKRARIQPFTAEDLRLLETLAAQAAIALENARLYEELRRSEEIIRRADRLSALGTLAAGIAHEINNPLVAIQTFFQLAPQRLSDREFLTEFLELTAQEVRRITSLIAELLSFARSPSRSVRDVDANEIIDSVVRLLEPQVRKNGVTILKVLRDSISVTRGDHDQLKQVFLNIILNAIQAMEPNGGVVTIETLEVTHNGEKYVQVCVADTGSGIPAEIIGDIFNPFLTTKDSGTGLGLAISNQVISEHGGFILVDSTVGKGSTFRIYLRPWYAFEAEERRA
jgi:two-component system NtrC family sensor kinase